MLPMSYLLLEDSIFSGGRQPHPHPLQEKMEKKEEIILSRKGENGEQGHRLVS